MGEHKEILETLEELLKEEKYWSVQVNRANRTNRKIIDIKIIPV